MTARLSSLLAFALLTTLCLGAPARAVELRGLARLGGDFGGDRILSLQYSDGSTQDILGGQGVMLTMGVASEVLQFGESALDAQLDLGLKMTTMAQASNADLQWLRWPIELLAFYKFKPWHLRFGLGATFQLGNHLEGSGAIAGRYDFDPALGLVVQAEYALAPNVGIDLRYTALRYTLPGASVNASSLGFGVSYVFEIVKPAAAPAPTPSAAP